MSNIALFGSARWRRPSWICIFGYVSVINEDNCIRFGMQITVQIKVTGLKITVLVKFRTIVTTVLDFCFSYFACTTTHLNAQSVF